jgi:hypothetical protein
MSSCTVTMKDGTSRRFEDRGAPGGSYGQSTEFKDGWLVITDAYGGVTAIPSAEVAAVNIDASRRC